MKKQLLLLVMMLLPMVAMAYDFKSDGLFFNILSSTEKFVEITSGDGTYNFGEKTLPSTVTYKNIEFVVTKIGDGAFGYATFDGITIPTSIKSIGYRAFAYSSNYNKPYYICFEGDISINREAFWCSWYGTFIFKNSKAPVLIDDSNTGDLAASNPIMCIPDGADEESFMEFASRGRVVPYDYSTDISMLKFLALSQFLIDLNGYEYEIISLAKPYSAMLTAVKKNDSIVTLPSSVTYNDYLFNVFRSGENIFSNENSLRELVIPEGYISMEGSIGKCGSLTKISIPSTITKINKTFINCPNLEQVVSSINAPFETDAFNTGVTSLFTTLYVPDGAIEKYETTTPWNEFLSILPFSKLAKYKLVYIVDNAVYKEIEYEFGASIIPEAAPTKEGYTFSGWSDIPETMPAHDVTVTGTFIKDLPKCATPTIQIVDGKLKLSCETEGVTFVTSYTSDGLSDSTLDDEIVLVGTTTCHVSVYATKEGYENSDVATADVELYISKKGDVNADGEVNVGDIVTTTNIMAGKDE